ncbi:hypothetical protein, conserved [Leishmania tarentolae]|uniref:DUF1935 domain-containing protein n=1 Tax=Leishmania tarentolae TaxID=5689 RepID=A0A640KEQ2_LEITA|nr:hypothetical protein, conserved [Leishmania tarentolae]
MGCGDSKDIRQKANGNTPDVTPAGKGTKPLLREIHPASMPVSPVVALSDSAPELLHSESAEDYEEKDASSPKPREVSVTRPAEHNAGSGAESPAAAPTSEHVSAFSTSDKDREQDADQLITLNEQQRRLPARVHEKTQAHFMVDDSSPYAGPGPAMEFPIDHVYRCFEKENGLLFRLVNEKRHMWAFYNDTDEYMMRISVTFGPESSIEALGSTRQIFLNDETGQCQLALDVAPGETQIFMRGEYNGFSTCYNASPISVGSDAET